LQYLHLSTKLVRVASAPEDDFDVLKKSAENLEIEIAQLISG